MEALTQLRCGDLVEICGALATTLDAHAGGLDDLDLWSGGRGDVGSDMAAASARVVDALRVAPAMKVPTDWADAVGAAARAGGGGRGGGELLAFMSAMGTVATSRDALDAAVTGLALEAGAEALGTSTPVAHVAAAAAAAALGVVDAGAALAVAVVAAADAALDALEGRAPDGEVDAISAGLCVLFDVIVAHVHGDVLDLVGDDDSAPGRSGARVDDPLYTVRCRIEVEAPDAERLATALAALASPVEVERIDNAVAIVAGVEDLGPFIEALCRFGRPRGLAIEDRRSRG